MTYPLRHKIGDTIACIGLTVAIGCAVVFGPLIFEQPDGHTPGSAGAVDSSTAAAPASYERNE